MTEYIDERRTGRVGKQAQSKELHQRLAMLEAFLREGTLCANVGSSENHNWMSLSCLCVAKQWKIFIGKLMDTYCRV